MSTITIVSEFVSGGYNLCELKYPVQASAHAEYIVRHNTHPYSRTRYALTPSLLDNGLEIPAR